MKKNLTYLITMVLLLILFFSPDIKVSAYTQNTENAAWIANARSALQELLENHTVMALVYLSDTYPIYAEPSFQSSTVVTVKSGQQVLIQDVSVEDVSDEVWAAVTCYVQEKQYTGYIPRRYLACSDELFLKWEAEWNMNPSQSVTSDSQTGSGYADIDQFPESYRAALIALKQAHPNWTFVKMNTNLDWNTVVANELVDGRSLIPSSFPTYMQNGLYSKGWAYASKATLEFYLDPRNGLSENSIFQFEQLTYNASYHTETAVQRFLTGTFMSGTIPNMSITYANAFQTAGSSLGVSPFHLACRVYQEQGKGTSPLISGTYPGYQGYYNYFNINASGKTDKEIYESGLSYAKEKGWTDGYLSIYGGAKIISANYILKGQDTLYLQKFDVDDSYHGLYWHQYMQNICAPTSEGSNIRKSYEQAGSLNNTFVFKIPVYNNMPSSACPKPALSLDISLTPPSGYTDLVIYLDGIAYPATFTNGTYTVTAPDGNVKTAVMYYYENDIPKGMYVWELSFNGMYTALPVPAFENLLSYHGFSIRITGNSGIRFKSGISAPLRAQFLTGGVDGYTLKEYGTLVMTQANSQNYPFIKGGEKVGNGKSYGRNPDGSLLDMIFETVDNRHRYTSVLVNLPSVQYKTFFSFRGYMILEKNGKEVILYGPPVSKSIYSLAKQILDSGYYTPGSSADIFLKQLMEDADNMNKI